MELTIDGLGEETDILTSHKYVSLNGGECRIIQGIMKSYNGGLVTVSREGCQRNEIQPKIQ